MLYNARAINYLSHKGYKAFLAHRWERPVSKTLLELPAQRTFTIYMPRMSKPLQWATLRLHSNCQSRINQKPALIPPQCRNRTILHHLQIPAFFPDLAERDHSFAVRKERLYWTCSWYLYRGHWNCIGSIASKQICITYMHAEGRRKKILSLCYMYASQWTT